jgi:uncharacterized protein (TIGR00369 family)
MRRIERLLRRQGEASSCLAAMTVCQIGAGTMGVKMDRDSLNRFLRESFSDDPGEVVELSEKHALMKLDTGERHLRPGGTISGPTMMGLADAAMYALILGNLGPVALAVTTNLNINFYRKPAPGVLHARATMLKLGKRLAVGEVLLYCDDPEASVAHVTLTYSIPPAADATA